MHFDTERPLWGIHLIEIRSFLGKTRRTKMFPEALFTAVTKARSRRGHRQKINASRCVHPQNITQLSRKLHDTALITKSELPSNAYEWKRSLFRACVCCVSACEVACVCATIDRVWRDVTPVLTSTPCRRGRWGPGTEKRRLPFRAFPGSAVYFICGKEQRVLLLLAERKIQ